MNPRNPTTLVLAALGLLLVGIVLLVAFAIPVPPVVWAIILAGTVGMGGFLYYLLQRQPVQDDMIDAMDYVRAYVAKVHNGQTIKEENARKLRRKYKPDPTPYFGFILERSGGGREGKFLNIVLEKTDGRFNVVKEYELVDDGSQDVQNPFARFETEYTGGPTHIAEADPWKTGPGGRGRKGDKITFNMGAGRQPPVYDSGEGEDQ